MAPVRGLNLKKLFGKLTPYADDVARGVSNYGDDALRLASNYNDNATRLLDNARIAQIPTTSNTRAALMDVFDKVRYEYPLLDGDYLNSLNVSKIELDDMLHLQDPIDAFKNTDMNDWIGPNG